MALMERVRKTKNEYLIEQDPGVDESTGPVCWRGKGKVATEKLRNVEIES